MKWILAWVLIMFEICAGAAAGTNFPQGTTNDWSMPGCLWANYTTTLDPKVCCGAVADGVTDDYSALTNAIGTAANDTIIDLGTGEYYLSKPIKIGPWGSLPAYLNKRVWLKGRGPGLTKLFMHGTGALEMGIYIRGGNYGSDLMVTSGATQGSRLLSLSATTGLVVGDIVMVGQTNDTSYIRGDPDRNASAADDWNPTNGVNQYFHAAVTNINGLNITLDRELPETWNNLPFVREMTPAKGVYVSDLWIYQTNRDTSAASIGTFRAWNCGISNVLVTDWYTYGIQVQDSSRCTVMYNVVTNCSRASSSTYGIQLTGGGSDNYVVDNIVGMVSSAILIQTGYRNVVAYNFVPWGYPTNFSGIDCLGGALNLHGFNAAFNLMEGNIVGKIYSDDTWGVNRTNTAFRNWATRLDPFRIPDTVQFCIAGFDWRTNNYGGNIVGNVIGHPSEAGSGKNSWYFGDDETSSGPNDPGVTNTMFFAENTSFENNTTNSLNGASMATLPPSLYLTNKPAFFGVLPFPLMGRDVPGWTNFNPAAMRFYGLSYFSTNAPAVAGTNVLQRIFYWFFGPQ